MIFVHCIVYYIRLTVVNGLTLATSISWFDIKVFINMPFLIRLSHIISLLQFIAWYTDGILEYIGCYIHAFCYNYAIIIIIY